jgi:hypothetical protein
VLDEAVRDVLARLDREDAEERAQGLPPEQPQTGCEVLEVGGSRGYSSISWS